MELMLVVGAVLSYYSHGSLQQKHSLDVVREGMKIEEGSECCSVAGSEERGRGHKPRNVSSNQKLKDTRKQILQGQRQPYPHPDCCSLKSLCAGLV